MCCKIYTMSVNQLKYVRVYFRIHLRSRSRTHSRIRLGIYLKAILFSPSYIFLVKDPISLLLGNSIPYFLKLSDWNTCDALKILGYSKQLAAVQLSGP